MTQKKWIYKEKINNLSKCHMGPVCPLLMFDETVRTNIHILFHLNIIFIIVIQMMNNIMNELIYFIIEFLFHYLNII